VKIEEANATIAELLLKVKVLISLKNTRDEKIAALETTGLELNSDLQRRGAKNEELGLKLKVHASMQKARSVKMSSIEQVVVEQKKENEYLKSSIQLKDVLLKEQKETIESMQLTNSSMTFNHVATVIELEKVSRSNVDQLCEKSAQCSSIEIKLKESLVLNMVQTTKIEIHESAKTTLETKLKVCIKETSALKDKIGKHNKTIQKCKTRLFWIDRENESNITDLWLANNRSGRLQQEIDYTYGLNYQLSNCLSWWQDRYGHLAALEYPGIGVEVGV
jgi:hypothetical protein